MSKREEKVQQFRDELLGIVSEASRVRLKVLEAKLHEVQNGDLKAKADLLAETLKSLTTSLVRFHEELDPKYRN